ncbi:MAG: hypothetical protein J7L42_00045 [Elusimicrobia bacterium]|nr:hypothetical protein [Elusimicrobiota bacterium]
MRKKVFIIHGKGVKNGIGREAGGDLDTICSNVFYTVWAKESLKEELLREPIENEDYTYDFVNYAEGLYHLAAYRGCDVYLPDFPIDTLAPRVFLMEARDERLAPLIKKVGESINDFRIWAIENSQLIPKVFKEILNGLLNNGAKIVKRQQPLAIEVSFKIIEILRKLSEIAVESIRDGKKPDENIKNYLVEVLKIMKAKKFREAKSSVLDALNNEIKFEMSEIFEEKKDILFLDLAHKLDLKTRGRISYTDEFVVFVCESISWLERTYRELDEVPFDEEHKKELLQRMERIKEILRNIFSEIEKKTSAIIETGLFKEELSVVLENSGKILEILENLQKHPPSYSDGKIPIRVILLEEATARAVDGIELIFERVKGSGRVFDRNGNEIPRKAILKTDKNGECVIFYEKTSEDETFQFSVTFDGMQYMFIPEEISMPQEISGGEEYADEISEEMVEEEIFSKKDSEILKNLNLKLIEKMFKFLRSKDVYVCEIYDHHPYTKEIYDLLLKLKSEGVIGDVYVHAPTRGGSEFQDNPKCGADIVYEKKIKGKRWDYPGLKLLRELAHYQDLHIKTEPLAIELSKLIGSSFNKIEMVKTLSEIKTQEELKTIMQKTGWDKKVKEYEEGLAEVLPRTQTNMLYMDFLRKPEDGDYQKHLLLVDKIRSRFAPKSYDEKIKFLRKLYMRNPKNRLRILGVLSPFTDAKKGEAKINVASAINYLVREKGFDTDYFFYCYGSEILVSRKPNEEDKTLNLGLLMQHIGTPADGGHSGAATSKPLSNPGFPRKRLVEVGEKNFIEFLHYIGGKVEEFAKSLEFYQLRPVEVEEYPERYEKVLKRLKYNLIEYVFEKPDEKEKIRAIITKPPFVSKNTGEVSPGFTQIFEYIGRLHNPDYIFFIQGGMNSFMLLNWNDTKEKLDLVELAQKIGWDEDGGVRRFAIATPRRNKRIKKELRWLRDADFLMIVNLIAKFINESSQDWKITEVNVIAAEIEKDEKPPVFADRLYTMEFARDKSRNKVGANTFKMVCVIAPFTDRSKGEFSLPISLVKEGARKLGGDFLLYIDYRTIHLVKISDKKVIPVSKDVVKNLTGKICELDEITSFDKDQILDLPQKFEKLYRNNMVDFLKYLGDRIGDDFGYFCDWPKIAGENEKTIIKYPVSS